MKRLVCEIDAFTMAFFTREFLSACRTKILYFHTPAQAGQLIIVFSTTEYSGQFVIPSLRQKFKVGLVIM